MKPTIPKPQFAGATEEEISKALIDSKSNAPLAAELARIMEAYSENCAEYILRFGRVPETFLRTPATAIEKRALSQIKEALAEDAMKAQAGQGPPRPLN